MCEYFYIPKCFDFFYYIYLTSIVVRKRWSLNSVSHPFSIDVGQSEEAPQQDIYLASNNIQGRYFRVLRLNN